MKMPDIPYFFNIAKVASNARRYQGQTSIEYLLLLAVVAVVVIASFGPGSLVSKVHDSAQGYYNSVTRVIMGENPQPINGGWCPVTCPSGSGPAVMYKACECPAPAFGGAPCSGSGAVDCTAQGTVPCGPCPTGEVCNSSGTCVCPIAGETYNGSACVPSCGANMWFNPQTNACECNAGAFWNGTGCVYCAACQTYNGTSCVPVVCPANMWCNPAAPPDQECQCDAGTHYVGPGCAY